MWRVCLIRCQPSKPEGQPTPRRPSIKALPLSKQADKLRLRINFMLKGKQLEFSKVRRDGVKASREARACACGGSFDGVCAARPALIEKNTCARREGATNDDGRLRALRVLMLASPRARTRARRSCRR